MTGPVTGPFGGTRFRVALKPSGLKRAEAGFALVIVLWAGVLSALIVFGVLAATRSHYAVVAQNAALARAKSIAEGGIHLTIHALLDPARRAELTFGAPLTFAIGEGQARVLITNEGGKIDLRAANGALLSTMFSVCGWSDQKAQDLTGHILALRRSGEGGGLRALGDLVARAGLSTEEVLRLQTVLTLHSGLDVPQEPVVPAVSEALDVWFAKRGIRRRAGPAPLVAEAGRLRDTHDVVAIEARAMPSGPVAGRMAGEELGVSAAPFALRAVVRLLPGAPVPYRILSWQRVYGTRQPEDEAGC